MDKHVDHGATMQIEYPHPACSKSLIKSGHMRMKALKSLNDRVWVDSGMTAIGCIGGIKGFVRSDH